MKSEKAARTSGRDDMAGVEKELTILLSDIIGYSRKTDGMRPSEIKEFMLLYHRNLKKIVKSVCGKGQSIESSAGDGAVALFQREAGQGKDQMCGRALNVALEMVRAMEKGTICETRIGLFTGDVIEAVLDGKTMRFGASFSVASRLEELCGFFGVKILMDREVAFWQTENARYLTSIGKVRPKNFSHPVHIFSIYQPGIHQCPEDVDVETLMHFIQLKNRAIELFCGNVLQGIHPDFPLARQRLLECQELFVEMTGKKDLPTERILEYIGNNPSPEGDFQQVGMKIGEPLGQNLGVRLLNLSSELLKSMNEEIYQTLAVDTAWERKFKLVWRKKNEPVIHVNDSPDGVYFIDVGSVDILDDRGVRLTTLKAGDVFGEMAYFSKKGVRSATVIAKTNLVLRRISGEDLKELPVIKKIFKKIAQKRKTNKSP
ncbi:MAG: cyclic nucleotide-binding domain-containing protein [Pseudomonadota bacterium]